MDPKTILAVCFVLIFIGGFLKNLLYLLGLTKTKINGGALAETIYFAAIVANFIGYFILTILSVTNFSTITNFLGYLFGVK